MGPDRTASVLPGVSRSGIRPILPGISEMERSAAAREPEAAAEAVCESLPRAYDTRQAASSSSRPLWAGVSCLRPATWKAGRCGSGRRGRRTSELDRTTLPSGRCGSARWRWEWRRCLTRAWACRLYAQTLRPGFTRAGQAGQANPQDRVGARPIGYLGKALGGVIHGLSRGDFKSRLSGLLRWAGGGPRPRRSGRTPWLLPAT